MKRSVNAEGDISDRLCEDILSGQFPPGSMGPKVRSAIDFVQHGGGTAVITSAAHLADGLDPTSRHGTRIVPSTVMSRA